MKITRYKNTTFKYWNFDFTSGHRIEVRHNFIIGLWRIILFNSHSHSIRFNKIPKEFRNSHGESFKKAMAEFRICLLKIKDTNYKDVVESFEPATINNAEMIEVHWDGRQWVQNENN